MTQPLAFEAELHNQQSGNHAGRVARLWFPISLFIVIVAGFAVRYSYIQRYLTSPFIGGDQFYYYYWPAVGLARGQGIIDFTSLQYGYLVPQAAHAPGFIIFIAGLYKAGITSPLHLRYAMAILGLCNIMLVALLVRSLVSRRAAIIAAVIAALYPNIWINDVLLMSEGFVSFGLLIAFHGIYRYWQKPSWLTLAFATIGASLAASARPEILLLFPLAIAPVVIARTDCTMQKRLAQLGVSIVLPCTLLVAWGTYNKPRFSHPVYTSTVLGGTIRIGACDTTFYGKDIGSLSLTCQTSDNGTIQGSSAPPLTHAQSGAYLKRLAFGRAFMVKHGTLPKFDYPNPTPPLGARRDESIDDLAARHAAFDYIHANLRQLPKVVVAREARTVGLWNPHQQIAIETYQARGTRTIVMWAQRAFWVLCALSLLGAAVWRRRRVPLYPLFAPILITITVVAMTFGMSRYRAPVEFVIVILAASALDGVLRTLSGRYAGSTTSSSSSDIS